MPAGRRAACGCSGSTRARSVAVARICMAAPKRRSAAGGGAARRSRWPGVQTAGAASTGATRAASAWHANVAFAPRRTRQHAWNLHQHCTLAQVPLIDLKSILLKNFAKRIYFKITTSDRIVEWETGVRVMRETLVRVPARLQTLTVKNGRG